MNISCLRFKRGNSELSLNHLHEVFNIPTQSQVCLIIAVLSIWNFDVK